jgi:hypothetical protein
LMDSRLRGNDEVSYIKYKAFECQHDLAII